MALTATQLDWLENDNVRVILVEAAYTADPPLILYCNNGNTNSDYPNIYCNTTYISSIQTHVYCNSTAILASVGVAYYSNTPYVSEFGVAFDNVIGNSVQDIPYDDILQTIPNITSKIDASSSIGTLTFLNTMGDYDESLTWAWDGWPIKVLMGSPSWDRDDFIEVFNGIIDSVTAPNTTSFNITVRNKNDILSKNKVSQTITTDYVSNKLNAATQFTLDVEVVPIVGDPLASIAFDPSAFVVPDAILNTRVPTCLGKCYNVEPILIDAYNHVYLIHDGAISGILEIDGVKQIKSDGIVLNGVPPVEEGDPALQYEIDLNIGCIRLLDHARSTKITVDVEGAVDTGSTLTKNSAAWIVEWLALQKTPLLAADLDAASFTALDTANNAELGVFFKGEESVADLMTQIMSSIGGYYRFNRTSLLQVTRLDEPDNLPAATVTIEQDYVEHNGISLAATEAPRAQITMSYQKNWTVLDKIAGILEVDSGFTTAEVVGQLANAEQLSTEYQTLSVINSGVKLEYPLAETYDTVETLIFAQADAQTEINRRAGIRDTKRFVFKVQSLIPTLNLEVGDTVDIIYDRFGFDSPGKKAVVIGLSEKLTNNRVEIEAWL